MVREDFVRKNHTQLNESIGVFLPFNVVQGTDSTGIASSSNHNQVSVFEFDKVNNFSGGQIDLYSVIYLDQWIWVTNGASVILYQRKSVCVKKTYGSDVRDFLGGKFLTNNTAKLVSGFFSGDAMKNESSLGVVQ